MGKEGWKKIAGMMGTGGVAESGCEIKGLRIGNAVRQRGRERRRKRQAGDSVRGFYETMKEMSGFKDSKEAGKRGKGQEK